MFVFELEREVFGNPPSAPVEPDADHDDDDDDSS